MTTMQIAALFDARPGGRGRWQARCPAHDDRSPSLSITEADDGRTLIHCFRGCATEQVLSAAGLSMRDLFDGPPPTPEQARHAAEEREEREAATRRLHALHGNGCDRLHRLEDIAESLGARLMWMPASGEADALTAQFDETLDDIRRLEPVLIRIERWS